MAARAAGTRSELQDVHDVMDIPLVMSQQLGQLFRETAVRRVAQLWMQSRAWLRPHKARFGLFFRVTASALLSFELASWLGLHMPLWAVLTAIIVTQISVGRSLKASLDYLGGTIGGAIYGAVVGVLVGGGSEVALLAGLAIAVGPLALIAAMRQGLTAAPITAAIVLVVPSLTNATPIASAVDRVLEVALGAVMGLTISLCSSRRAPVVWRSKRQRVRSIAWPVLWASSWPA